MLRRCQLLLASARGQTARVSADTLGCDAQTVRHVIAACNTHGVAVLTRRSSAPRRTPQAAFEAARREQLRTLLHQSPRTCGHPTSQWTLALAATTADAAGLTARPVSGEALRRALARLGVRWKRAKHWITSPDPADMRKKNGATGSWRSP